MGLQAAVAAAIGVAAPPNGANLKPSITVPIAQYSVSIGTRTIRSCSLGSEYSCQLTQTFAYICIPLWYD